MDLQPEFIAERASAALRRTARLIEQFPGRLAGRDACQRTAETLCGDFQRLGLSTQMEAFQTHPTAFSYFYRVDAIIYLVGLALLFAGQPLAAGLLLTFMIIAAGLEFGWYAELYDWLFPRQTCYNLTATLEPRGPARRQLIFSAHHDAAFELHLLRGNQKVYGLRILVPDACRMTAALFSWTWVVWQAVAGQPPAFTPYVMAFLVVGVYFVFTKFFGFGPNVVPGAGDNLIASSMLVELAQMLADPQSPGRSVLEDTRLIFASFDAEESGLRGSRAWVKAHRADFQALPTRALNIDSIYAARDLQFMISDLNSHVKLDRSLAQQCIQIAGQAGFPAQEAVMRFGGGATDATELMQAGVPSTTMIAMQTNVVRDGLVYHTMKDTVDAIEPAAVEACLSVAYQLARAEG